MPRGVAIPDVEQQLFDAAERILVRDGPEGLTSRAITDEAGTAKGLLYRHFADLDAFLAAFVHDRAARLAETVRQLPERAGTGTVVDNLTDAALSCMPRATGLANLMRSRWSVADHLAGHADHLTRHRQAHDSGVVDVEAALAAYLDAERDAGRVGADVDTEAVATALVAVMHQLAMTADTQRDLDSHVRRVVKAVVGGLLPPR